MLEGTAPPPGRLRRRLALGGAALLLGCPVEPLPPDILLVSLDTLRRDHVGAYGGSGGLTPHLDALAAGGLVHEAAYTTMPTTGPAHLSLFTGLHASRHGGRRNGEPVLPEWSERELARRLAARGYVTAAFVTAGVVGPGMTGLRGFGIYDGPRDLLRSGAEAVEAALAWLDVERRRPVFLWLHVYEPHAPYGAPAEKRLPVDPARHGWVDAGLYDSPEERREIAAAYARGVAAADEALGAIVAGVRERLERPPLVLVVADHGESLAEHLEERGFAYDHGKFLDAEGVAIPLILAGPGVEVGRSRGAASIRDLYTTILGAAGLDDASAAAEGRRDLRRASDARRVVRIERRHFPGEVPALVHDHAAAAADGRSLSIVDERGEPAAGSAPATDLLAAAREQLAERSRWPGQARPLPDETREALRALGYSE